MYICVCACTYTAYVCIFYYYYFQNNFILLILKTPVVIASKVIYNSHNQGFILCVLILWQEYFLSDTQNIPHYLEWCGQSTNNKLLATYFLKKCRQINFTNMYQYTQKSAHLFQSREISLQNSPK